VTARAGGVGRTLRWLGGLGWVPLGGLALLGVLALYGLRRWHRYQPRLDVPLAADFRLGYNMDFPGDWTNLPPFIDHMKNARGMHGACSERDADCDPTAHLDLDASGWVKTLRYRDEPSLAYERIEIILNTSQQRSDIGQSFVVTWQGQGTIEVYSSPAAVVEPVRHRITFELPKEIAMLRLTAIDPGNNGDYLRDIRVFRADQEEALRSGEVFNPELRSFLAPFRSLRFMDWMHSNAPGRCSGGKKADEACYAQSNEVCEGGVCVMPGKWSERPTPDQAMWLSSAQFLDDRAPERGTKVGGYPVETMVALANAVGQSPHFNIPADSDDDYVRKFAEYVRGALRPDLPVSVEYSNEVWNWGFPQAGYAKVRGAQMWPDEGTAWIQYMAVRTHNMCKLFRQVFQGQEERLRCLISPQTGWRGLATEVLDCPAWVKQHPEDESCTKYVDAVNVSGYFAGCLPKHPEVISRWLAAGHAAAMDQAFQQLEHGGLIPGCEDEGVDTLDYAIETYGYFMQVAARRGLGLEVYEGGTHFNYEADDAAVKQFFVDLTRDPRMYDAYLRNYAGFKQAGGSTFNVWGWVGPNDAWANANSPTDLDHPKYRAIRDFARGALGGSLAPR
jgi:hypothetical protein